MLLLLSGPQLTASISSNEDLGYWLVSYTFPPFHGPSQMAPSPEKWTPPLDEVNIRRLFCTVKFEVAFVNGTLYCWQRFPTVIPCPCGSISYWWMTCPLHTEIPPDSSKAFMKICTVEGEICKSLPRNIIFKHFKDFLTRLWTNWRSSAHLCSSKTHLFEITSLFILHCTALFALNCHHHNSFFDTVAGLKCRNGCMLTN